MADKKFDQQRRGQPSKLIQPSDDHFGLKDRQEPSNIDDSYKNVVPKEYDYLSQAAPRTVYQQKAPVKVFAEKNTNDRSPDKPLVDDAGNLVSASEFSSIKEMYEFIDLGGTGQSTGSSGHVSKVQTSSSMKTTRAASNTDYSIEEKNPFWDSLDPKNWVEDSKVKSCYRSQHDFSFLRRRHHCRKCGNIFCHECIRKRTIAGVTAKICTTCEELYDQYTRNICREMRRTRDNQHDIELQENDETANNMEVGWQLDPEVRRKLNEESHIISTYDERSVLISPQMKETYWQNNFASKELPKDKNYYNPASAELPDNDTFNLQLMNKDGAGFGMNASTKPARFVQNSKWMDNTFDQSHFDSASLDNEIRDLGREGVNMMNDSGKNGEKTAS